MANSKEIRDVIIVGPELRRLAKEHPNDKFEVLCGDYGTFGANSSIKRMLDSKGSVVIENLKHEPCTVKVYWDGGWRHSLRVRKTSLRTAKLKAAMGD